MRIGSLFTGVAGLDLAIPGQHAWMCENDRHCATVLERHFPGVPVYPDIRELDGSAPPVDLLCGGYPCQPFSVAGKRGGDTDPRHLWPEFARLIRLLRPRVVVAENVSGHLRLGFHEVLADLARLGMDVRWGVVRASDVGAPHQRARLFVVATDAVREPVRAGQRGAAGSPGTGEGEGQERQRVRADDGERGRAASDAEHAERTRVGRVHVARENGAQPAADAAGTEWRDAQLGGVGTAAERTAEHRERTSEVAWGQCEPAIRRWEHTLGRPAPRPTDDRGRLMPEFVEWMMGLPAGWTDGPARTHRLRMLGNAVVPQQAALALHLLSPREHGGDLTTGERRSS